MMRGKNKKEKGKEKVRGEKLKKEANTEKWMKENKNNRRIENSVQR